MLVLTRLTEIGCREMISSKSPNLVECSIQYHVGGHFFVEVGPGPIEVTNDELRSCCGESTPSRFCESTRENDADPENLALIPRCITTGERTGAGPNFGEAHRHGGPEAVP